MTVRFITRIPVIHGCRATSKNAASTSWYRSGMSSISRDKAEENSMRSSSTAGCVADDALFPHGVVSILVVLLEVRPGQPRNKEFFRTFPLFLPAWQL